ncbi:hypothetical protein BC629DRAFT_1724810 [Irpex lacteus]|nr:hypothetical protein BC629DRAFT_1724810 [Irpex lacteus]
MGNASKRTKKEAETELAAAKKIIEELKSKPLSGKKEQASEQHEPELEGRVQIVEAEANEMRAAAQAAAAAAAAIEHNEQQKRTLLTGKWASQTASDLRAIPSSLSRTRIFSLISAAAKIVVLNGGGWLSASSSPVLFSRAVTQLRLCDRFINRTDDRSSASHFSPSFQSVWGRIGSGGLGTRTTLAVATIYRDACSPDPCYMMGFLLVCGYPWIDQITGAREPEFPFPLKFSHDSPIRRGRKRLNGYRDPSGDRLRQAAGAFPRYSLKEFTSAIPFGTRARSGLLLPLVKRAVAERPDSTPKEIVRTCRRDFDQKYPDSISPPGDFISFNYTNKEIFRYFDLTSGLAPFCGASGGLKLPKAGVECPDWYPALNLKHLRRAKFCPDVSSLRSSNSQILSGSVSGLHA